MTNINEDTLKKLNTLVCKVRYLDNEIENFKIRQKENDLLLIDVFKKEADILRIKISEIIEELILDYNPYIRQTLLKHIENKHNQ